MAARTGRDRPYPPIEAQRHPALEAVVDRFGPEWNEMAGRAKDMGSAAVFLADINVLVCWGFLLLPRLAG